MVRKPGLGFIKLSLIFLLTISSVFGEKQKSYPEISEIKPGIFNFGQIEINKGKREISFPAVCNQTSGLIEYALVHEKGKVHESLFRTVLSPKLIHAAMLLLNENPQNEFFQILANDKKQISMIKTIQIFVEWEQNGTRQMKDLSTMVLNQTDNRKLTENAFVFTGSKVIEGIYLAEEDGSIVAVYHDNRATINCLDEQSDLDDVWIANYTTMPPRDLPVTIHFQLPKID